MRKEVYLVGLLALGACNAPFNPNLPPGNLAGVWSGTLSSADTSVGSVRLSVVPGPDIEATTPGGVPQWSMNGTWSASLPSGPDSGTVSGRGTAAHTVIHFTLQGTSGCSIELGGTQRGSSTISGQYAASSCLLPDSGTFILTR